MAKKAKGRGTAAAFGLLLLFAGLVGGAVLYVMSLQRHDDAVESFARAPVGCTTTLDFTETGVFYVYRETSGLLDPPAGGCEPTSDPLQVFGFELEGPGGAVVPRRDDSISYDTDDFSGAAVARVEIDAAGEYTIAVVGDDDLLVAAVGRDPDDGVAELRNRAIAAAVAGVVLGLLLLVLAGRRSKKAAVVTMPEGPGWGPAPGSAPGAWPPEAPNLDQVPVNPHAPSEPAVAEPPLPARTPTDPSPWAPPASDAAPTGEVPPEPPPSPPPPTRPNPPTPTLPNTPGQVSGVSPSVPSEPPSDD